MGRRIHRYLIKRGAPGGGGVVRGDILIEREGLPSAHLFHA